MFTVNAPRAADELLEELRARGLVVKLETIDGKTKGRHWHMGYDKQPGVLEVTDLGHECELKVASNRDGGWATALAREVASVKR